MAVKGKCSYLNDKKLQVSRKSKFKDSVLGFSLPSQVKLARKSLYFLSKNYGTFRALRNSGSAALNLCYIADNKFDLYLSLKLHSWDVAAAKLIVEEAGGKCTNLYDKKWKIKDNNIVASNNILHDKFINLIK